MRRKLKKYVIKPLFAFTLVFSLIIFTAVIYVTFFLPDSFQINEGSALSLDTKLPISVKYQEVATSNGEKTENKTMSANLNVFGFVPTKSVSVSVVGKNQVVLSGAPFGIKIYTNGVLVVDVDSVDTEKGNKSPAAIAGIKPGDYILTVDGEKVQTNEDVANLIEKSGGKEVAFLIMRNNRQLTVYVKPEISYLTGKYKAGVWVKDSGAGIGTLTFYSPSCGLSCGLGHGISDSDTGKILTIESGELVDAEILGITKGTNGTPGELKGRFKNKSIGKLLLNNETGVYAENCSDIDFSKLTEVAYKQDISIGKAQVLTTINNDDKPKLYDCEIKKISFTGGITKNMIIKITDKELLNSTGGIVQGMSGSPIIQNGKLVGAITHVFVDNPTEGYAIFAENMLKTAETVAKEQLKKAS